MRDEYEPSQAEIRECCLEIQRHWSEYERLSRAGLNDGDGGSVYAWTMPTVKMPRDAVGRCVVGL